MADSHPDADGDLTDGHPAKSSGPAVLWERRAVRLSVLAALAAVGGLLPSFSVLANLYVAAIGGTLFWLGLSSHVPRRQVPYQFRRAALWWLAPVLALAAVELVTFARGSTADYPTLSVLADPMLETYLGRSAFCLVWIAGFWGLARR